jgi:hypothetical protein
LLLPSRELADSPPLESREIHHGQGPLYPSPKVLATNTQGFQSEGNILAYVEVRKKRIVLKDHPEPPRNGLEPSDIIPFHEHSARVGHFKTRQQPQRGGLSAPTRSEQREHLASLELEGYQVDGDSAAETLRQVFKL